MIARTLMIQGTASSVGKSITVTALCRILRQDGYSVAPFKAQNMALNSFVTAEGGEIGRSQAIQAEAAGIQPSVHMNPVLLKPQTDATSQVIVLGKAHMVSDATDYYRSNLKLLPVIEKSLATLRNQYDIVIIEGAGSPAEVNLMDKEIANMRIAELANAPVVLIGDIDRGGVFASIVGTMQLLPLKQRRLVKGFIINKFRGDITLLQPGLQFLEKRCRRPVLGVLPYMRAIGIAQEDSVFLDERHHINHRGRPDIAIIRLPHIANYDDFDPLETSCNVRYISTVGELCNPDLIILPGSKSTINDVGFLHRSGVAINIIEQARAGTPVIGICAGYQMLGRKILDPCNAESKINEADGLGLLDMETVFESEKVTAQVKARVAAADAGLFKDMNGIDVIGYEIHMGKCVQQVDQPLFNVMSSNNSRIHYSEGAMNKSGTVAGTHIHGLFDNEDFTRRLLHNLCSLRNIPQVEHAALSREKAYDELALTFRQNLDMHKIYTIITGGTHGREGL